MIHIFEEITRRVSRDFLMNSQWYRDKIADLEKGIAQSNRNHMILEGEDIHESTDDPV